MMSIKEFAEMYNIKHRQWVSYLIKQGRIQPPPKKFGNMWTFTGKEKIISVKTGRQKKNKYDEKYLKGLRDKAKKSWLGNINPDEWLKETKGGWNI